MSRVKRWQLFALALVMLLMGIAYPAEAVEPPPPQELASMEGVSLEKSWTISTEASGGKTVCGSAKMYNIFDKWLWTLTICRYFEYDGTKVTSAPVFGTPKFTRSTIGKYWLYDGATDAAAWWSNCSGSHSHSCHTRERTSKVRLNVAGYDMQTEYPWIRVKVYYDGRWAGAGGW